MMLSRPIGATIAFLATAAAVSGQAPEEVLDSLDGAVAHELRFFEGDAAPANPEWVAEAMRRMSRADQILRLAFNRVSEFSGDEAERFRSGIVDRVTRIDEGNVQRLRTMIPDGSWFRISRVGQGVARDAWLLVQHADRDVAFQRDVLRRMRELPKDEVEARLIAYLHDRVAMHDDRPQRFGTQGDCVEGAGWVPHRIEDPEAVDRRRAEVGLGPLEAYVRGFDELCS